MYSLCFTYVQSLCCGFKYVYYFTNSPKRQQELEKHNIQAKENNSSTRGKLVSMCKTWRVTQIDALEVFIDQFPAVVSTFESIAEGSSNAWNSESARATMAL